MFRAKDACFLGREEAESSESAKLTHSPQVREETQHSPGPSSPQHPAPDPIAFQSVPGRTQGGSVSWEWGWPGIPDPGTYIYKVHKAQRFHQGPYIYMAILFQNLYKLIAGSIEIC